MNALFDKHLERCVSCGVGTLRRSSYHGEDPLRRLRCDHCWHGFKRDMTHQEILLGGADKRSPTTYCTGDTNYMNRHWDSHLDTDGMPDEWHVPFYSIPAYVAPRPTKAEQKRDLNREGWKFGTIGLAEGAFFLGQRNNPILMDEV